MGTYDDASVGDRTDTQALKLDPQRVDRLIRDSGYVHPLFTDPEAAERAGFEDRPVPGQLLLALLAGLAEQAELVDETVIALIGMDSVRFLEPVLAGATIDLVAEVVARDAVGDRGSLTYHWTGRVDGRPAVEAEATFLFRRDA